MTRIGLSTKTPTTQANKARHNLLESPHFATHQQKGHEHGRPRAQDPSGAHQQRRKLGLTGRIRSGVLTLEQQAAWVWRQLQSVPTDLARNVLLDQLRCRNEILSFTGPNHLDLWQRWCGLLPSLVGAEGDQDGPLIP